MKQILSVDIKNDKSIDYKIEIYTYEEKERK